MPKLPKVRGESLGTILSVVLAFAVGGLMILLMGYDPVEAYIELFKGAFVGKFSIGTTLEKFSPILLTGIGYAVCVQTKYFNLGMEGCLYMGAVAAAGIGLIPGLPAVVHIPLGLLGGILAGTVWGAIPGALRVKYNVNEACSTIMFNYTATLLTSFMVFNVWREVTAVSRTPIIEKSAQFTKILKPSRASTAIFLLVFVVAVMVWLVYKTNFGFKLRATGHNMFFSNYVGFDAKKTVFLTVCISGAIGGLAGAMETMGVFYCVWDNFSMGTAFDGMLASLIAKNDIRKLPFTAFVLAALRAGAQGLERVTNVPKALVTTLVPMIIILISVDGIRDLLGSLFQKKAPQEAQEGVQG